MKYKILVSGNNPSLIMDFIQHTEPFFKTISTTPCMRDITAHFELFEPDAYICFVNSEHSSILPQINVLKDDRTYNGAGIFLICDAQTCNELENSAYLASGVDLLIRRPISVDNLVLRVTKYLDDKKEAQSKEDKRKAAIEEKIAEIIADEPQTKAEAENKVKEEKAPVPAPAPAPAAKKHILVVDDDRIILKMLKTALGEDYDVTTMVNGITAEKFLETKNVDLVILDYEMPIITGAEVFRKIKKNPRISHTPVCFLTGISEREKIMEVMSLKPHGYLLKPIDMEMLTATVINLLN